MPDIQAFTDTVALPLWALSALAVVALVLAIVFVARAGVGQIFGVLSVLCAAGLVWFYLDGQQRAEHTRTIEARLAALSAQARAPNSPLACLDNVAGDPVQEACEKSLFAKPEQVAAAVTYIGARLDVLREIAAIPERDQDNYEAVRAALVKSLASDRYGIVAHVLQTRDGCSAESCYAFELVQNSDQLAANLKESAYEARVARYVASWGGKPGGPALVSSPASAPYNPVDINFPAASSIPPVSIMSNEPGMTGQNGMDDPKATARPDAPTAAAPAAPPRRPAQKAQPPRQAAQPAQPTPFPQPVAPLQQTTGAPVPISPR